MSAPPPPCPVWLAERLRNCGGAVPFQRFMAWALHDPDHGAYGAGRLRIGRDGDFVTSPALGPDFAALLAPQLAAWLSAHGPGPLALVEAGPGEGALALELAQALQRHWPALAARTTLWLVEPNAGMAERQRRLLQASPLPCRWTCWQELAAAPVRGVVLAHEVLDALAVERIVWDGALWRRQLVRLVEGGSTGPRLRLEPGEPLEPEALAHLAALGLDPPGEQRPAGWCTELHPGSGPWLEACAAALAAGPLLVIDYALEAWRYYAPQRSAGTLLAYRGQRASTDPLLEPGAWDLTAHLCIDTLQEQARRAGWRVLGQCRQGEALLALGLAERLHGLQHDPPAGQASGLAERLELREALLRLVDPHTLGDFRWLAFSRGPMATPRFLLPPAPAP
ncbi:SAM-dependent methyltransferase [Cyanobium sp. NIES-981]|uniref:SAM-dependent methyltransferase n=1 Tax=Cyanobium sp. NIES-981 TaxID=1851505 RepID=UPI000B355D2F|nr:SAM-dependent methyltransferase [Cyanobium sp. NIES-981]